MSGDLLYSRPTICRYLGITERQLRVLRENWGLPTYNFGRTVAASKAALDAWLANQSAQANAAATAEESAEAAA